MTDVAARDRSVDAVRALAIAGVVTGHWLVTALVTGPDGTWRSASPLSRMPELAPLTWVCQTLGLFFFAAGFAAARRPGAQPPHRPAAQPPHRPAAQPRRRPGAGPAWSPRTTRLLRPAAVVLGCWCAALAVGAVAGVPAGTLRTLATLVVSPLWFLLPYAILGALTGPAARLVDRFGPAAVAPSVAVVAATDAGVLPGWLAVAAAWSVPWMLGIALARGRLHRRHAVAALTGGATTMAVLMVAGGYPVSAVGVPGAGRSNLDPPSLCTVALATVQIGLFALARPRLLARPWTPAVQRAVAALNRHAPAIYLTHQSALLVVVAVAVAATGGAAPGLLDAPDGAGWVAARIAWMPVLATTLALLARPLTRLDDTRRGAGTGVCHTTVKE
ncbi:membrane protein [Mangrovihabitans endophyticus]|uniref:Membrane protein n=1 Tax=Mangrovihabitans endophyticus TaxID=1751298 RepID=A0A8J3FMA9_9ACTN|nr:membrane protein [Mangrovihabitans endophyticus]